MRDVIEFIEQLGRNANVRLDEIDFESLLENEDFSPELKKALIDKDQNALEMLLNARSKIVCMILPAEDDDEEDDQPEPQEDEDQEAPKKENLAC